MDLHACQKCSVVNKSVELFYHGASWQKPEYLCVQCQKNAFKAFVVLLIIGYASDMTEENKKEQIRKMCEHIREVEEKNRITFDYWTKLVEYELKKLNKSKEPLNGKRD